MLIQFVRIYQFKIMASLSPITDVSFFNASIAAFSMSFVNSGTKKKFTFSAFDVVTC